MNGTVKIGAAVMDRTVRRPMPGDMLACGRLRRKDASTHLRLRNSPSQNAQVALNVPLPLGPVLVLACGTGLWTLVALPGTSRWAWVWVEDNTREAKGTAWTHI